MGIAVYTHNTLNTIVNSQLRMCANGEKIYKMNTTLSTVVTTGIQDRN